MILPLLVFTGLRHIYAMRQIVSCHTADSKPVKQEINGAVILPPLVFPATMLKIYRNSQPFFLLPLLPFFTFSAKITF